MEVIINTLIGKIIGILFTVFVLKSTVRLGNMYIIRKKRFRGTEEQIEEWRKRVRKEEKRQAKILAGMIVNRQ